MIIIVVLDFVIFCDKVSSCKLEGFVMMGVCDLIFCVGVYCLIKLSNIFGVNGLDK